MEDRIVVRSSGVILSGNNQDNFSNREYVLVTIFSQIIKLRFHISPVGLCSCVEN